MAGLLLAAVLASAASARAELTHWDRARDPAAGRAEAALRAAVRARGGRDLSDDPVPGAEALLALRAATLLEMAGGEGFESPEVDYFLADAWIEADRDADSRARRIFERALSNDPESPLAARAHFGVATAAARAGEFEAAFASANAALSLAWDPELRAQVFLLRAEVDLARGALGAARRDAEAALAVGRDGPRRALTRFVLAAAFARDDDLPDALAAAWEASQTTFQDPGGNAVTALELPGVRLLRRHDLFYHRALASMAVAEHSTDLAVKKVELEWAGTEWRRYLAEARVAGDRYVENATRLLASTERRLADVRRALASHHGSSVPRR